MNTDILIKYIKGTATLQECEDVMHWVEQSDENRKTLIMLTNMSAMLLPDEECSAVGEAEYNEFIEKLHKDNNKKGDIFGRNKRNIGRYIQYAAVVLLVISVTLNILQFSNRSHQRIEAQTLICGTKVADSLKREIHVAKGEKSRVELPDGSVVWLNSDSRITFPLKFSAQAREVSFSGEAYFEVVENPNHPMIVKLDNNYSLKVLGTTFNIKSYEEDNTIETTLYTGKIDIYQSGKETPIHSMTPNETFIIRPAVSLIPSESLKNISPDIMEKISAWKDGILYFDSHTVKEAARILERWYGIDIIIEDEEISDYTYTAEFENVPMANVLEDMREKLPLDYVIEESTIYLKR